MLSGPISPLFLLSAVHPFLHQTLVSAGTMCGGAVLRVSVLTWHQWRIVLAQVVLSARAAAGMSHCFGYSWIPLPLAIS